MHDVLTGFWTCPAFSELEELCSLATLAIACLLQPCIVTELMREVYAAWSSHSLNLVWILNRANSTNLRRGY